MTIQNIDTASEAPGFDPTSFLIVPAKRFDDLKVGDIFRAPSRTQIATAGYSSQADQFQIGGCLLWVAQASTVSSSRSSESAILGEANLRIGLKSSEVDWAIRWKAGDNARSGATPLTSQPQTNPTYQHPDPLYSSLALFETTNRAL